MSETEHVFFFGRWEARFEVGVKRPRQGVVAGRDGG